MTSRAHSFMLANAESPIVYASATHSGWFYRLENGKRFQLSKSECRDIGQPQWAHL